MTPPSLVADDRVVRAGLVGLAGAVALSVALAPVGEPGRSLVAGAVAVLLVAVGVPHGALDHLVLLADRPRTGSRPGRRHALAGLRAAFVVPYVALALVALAGYLLAPRAGFALFLALSVAHFAAGEAGVAVERGLARSWRDPLAWAAALGGAVVVVLPLSSREAGAALAAVDPRLAPVLAPLPPLAAALTACAAAAVLACTVGALRGDVRARSVGLELAALTTVALLAHPLLAFAAFFACWHSLRHQARLATLLRRDAATPRPGTAGRPLREVALSARAGLPATAGVLVVAAVLAAGGGATVLGSLLAVVWALTVPHAVAVAVLETRAARAARRSGGVPAAREPVAAPRASDGHDDVPAPPTPAPGAGPAPRFRPPAGGVRRR